MSSANTVVYTIIEASYIFRFFLRRISVTKINVIIYPIINLNKITHLHKRVRTVELALLKVTALLICFRFSGIGMLLCVSS